jgi:hypothetical protein
MGFIFGAQGLPKTPEELANLRAIALSLSRPVKAPSNIGEGLTEIGNALAYRGVEDRLSRGEAYGASQTSSAIAKLLSGGGGGATAPSATPASTQSAQSGLSIPPEASSPDIKTAGGLSGGLLTGSPKPPANVAMGVAPSDVQASRPDQIRGQLDFDGQKYDFGSGGGKNPSIPYGNYPITPNSIGPWGKDHGAIGINNNVIPDAKIGRDRTGIEIHAATNPELITQGCIAIAGSQWPQFRELVMKRIANGEKLSIHVDKDGVRITSGSNGVIGGVDTKTANANVISGNSGILDPTTAQASPLNSDQASQPQKFEQLAFNGSSPPITASPPTQSDNSGLLPYQEPQNLQIAKTVPAPIGVPQSVPQQAAPAANSEHSAIVQQLVEAAQNPWLSRSPVAQAIIRNRLDQALKSQDPASQLELQLKRAQLDKLQHPGAPDSVRALQERANLAGLQPGTPAYNQFMTSGGRSNQTIAPPEKGMRYVYDQNGNVVSEEPIPGGAADRSNKAKEEFAKQGQNIVLDDIKRAIPMADALTTGAGGAVFQSVPGTQAYDLHQMLQGIKANVGFDRLQQMRNSSPTGGALGSVSENENKLLQSVMGSLEQSQNKEQFLYNLKRLHNITADMANGTPAQLDQLLKSGKITQEQHDAALAQRYEIKQQGNSSPAPTAAAQQGAQAQKSIDDLLKKYGGAQ